MILFQLSTSFDKICILFMVYYNIYKFFGSEFMDFNSIKFSKLFADKHVGEVFNKVKDLIEK